MARSQLHRVRWTHQTYGVTAGALFLRAAVKTRYFEQLFRSAGGGQLIGLQNGVERQTDYFDLFVALNWGTTIPRLGGTAGNLVQQAAGAPA